MHISHLSASIGRLSVRSFKAKSSLKGNVFHFYVIVLDHKLPHLEWKLLLHYKYSLEMRGAWKGPLDFIMGERKERGGGLGGYGYSAFHGLRRKQALRNVIQPRAARRLIPALSCMIPPRPLKSTLIRTKKTSMHTHGAFLLHYFLVFPPPTPNPQRIIHVKRITEQTVVNRALPALSHCRMQNLKRSLSSELNLECQE